MKIRILNQVLCFIFFLLLVYLYAPQGFSQAPAVGNPPEDPALQEKINQAVEKKLDEVLPGYVEQEVHRRLPSAIAQKLREIKQREADQRERWLERNQDLRGRFMVGPVGTDGAYGVKFDISPGLNGGSEGGPGRLNVYYAKITPFIRVDGWGSAISLNVRKFLQNEIVKGELRDQISKLDFEDAYIYYRPINKDQVEVKVYLGQVPEPFIREVVDQTVFSNKSILDKYKLNTSMAARVDMGLGRVAENPNPNVVEREVWVQAANFNMNKDTNTFDDFAARILVSLSILNRFQKTVNFKPLEIWGGFARVGSGTPAAGETIQVTDPSQAQEMAVFGMKLDLTKLTSKELGEVFAEFVRRRKTDDITDQSWVIGWNKKLAPAKEGERPMEVGARFQSQQDDPDVTVADGSVLSAGVLIPLADYSMALRMNLGYIFQSTDPERDGEIIFATDFEVLW
ncbi:MAG: hypothetical protein HYY61_07185 [Deltaproteobacteria bacterium]|nr:hypothetical protein [Deltaproteobacteria bacterium]